MAFVSGGVRSSEGMLYSKARTGGSRLKMDQSDTR